MTSEQWEPDGANAPRRLSQESLDVQLTRLESGQPAALAGCDLSGLRIRRVDLRQADLSGSSLRDADLSDSDLRQVIGLRAHQLGGAILANARLPAEIADFHGLDQVAKISGHARTTFLAVIGGCVFSWLTVATATDAALLMNSAETALPIIQTKVPLAGFFLAAPYILLALYLYLHLYLQRLWDGLAELPAVFPDGRRLDQRAYPWLLIGMVSAYLPGLARRRPTAWRLQILLSVLLAWVLVPFTAILLWVRYLPRHDLIGSTVILIALLVAAWTGIAAFRRCALTLRGVRSVWVSRTPKIEALTCLFLAAAAGGLLWAALNGGPPNAGPARHLYANVAGAVLSAKPDGFRGRKEDYDLVVPARIEDFNLRRARGGSIFLARAEFLGSDMSDAQLFRADLTGASFEDSILQGTRLAGARLAQAQFDGSDLRRANLTKADLKAAAFRKSDLRGVRFTGADLRDSQFVGVDFAGASFEEAKLSGARFLCARGGAACVDLSRARDLTQAQLDSACGAPGTGLPDGMAIAPCRR